MKVKILGNIDDYLGRYHPEDLDEVGKQIIEGLLLSLKADLEFEFRHMIEGWKIKNLTNSVKRLKKNHTPSPLHS